MARMTVTSYRSFLDFLDGSAPESLRNVKAFSLSPIIFGDDVLSVIFTFAMSLSI